jgi:hypothetical protein
VRASCQDSLAAWPCAHTTTTLDTTLGQTHVVEAGDGEVVCVYLPGTNFNAATSTGLLTELAAKSRIVAVDLPGQPGLSDPARPHDETTAFAAWIDELLTWVRQRHHGLPLVLAGHSRGAAVALTASANLVDRLRLLSPAGLVEATASFGVLWATLPWLAWPSDRTAAGLLRVMSAPGWQPPTELVSWLAAVPRETRTSGAPGPLSPDVLDRWRQRDVVVVAGAHDCFFPAAELRRVAAAQLGVDVLMLADCGHLVVDESPARVASAVLGG